MNDLKEVTETIEPLKTALKKPAESMPIDPKPVEQRPAHRPDASPASHPPHVSRLHLAEDHDEDEGFFERHRVKVIAAALVLIGGAITYVAMTTERATVRRAPQKVINVQLPPPLPPPPPPPPPPKVQPPPPKEQKMIEQKPIEEPKDEPKPDDAPPPITTGISGKGAGDGLALGRSGNGGLIGGNGNRGNGGGKYDAYARQVQSTIGSVLRQHPKTRAASISRVVVRVWLDSTGRVTKAALGSSTGNAEVDAALVEALVGSQLPPPPADMPMPIVMRVSAQRR